MKFFNLFLCSSILFTCLTSSISFANEEEWETQSISLNPLFRRFKAKIQDFRGRHNPEIPPGNGESPFETLSTDVMGDVLAKMLETQDLMALSAVNRKCYNQTKRERNRRYELSLKPILNLEGEFTLGYIPVGFIQIGNCGNMRAFNGLIWSDRAVIYLTHEDAAKFCKNQGGRLPTKDELEEISRSRGIPALTAELYGYKERKFFWSSSFVPDNPDRAFVLNGVTGNIDHLVRKAFLSFLCVVDQRR